MFTCITEFLKKLGEKIGHVVSTILLSLIYILIVTLFGIFYRILNKQFFRFSHDYDTYWVSRKETEPTLENYRRQY